MNVLTQREFRKQARLMGSAFEFVVVADQTTADQGLQDAVDEVMRIETLLTEFSTTSDTAHVNINAGKKFTAVADEVFALIQRCKKIGELTQGAFDITAAPLKKLYNFKGEQFVLPSEKQIRETLQLVGSEKITLAYPNEVFLQRENMRISFAGVGKGYAADKVKASLQAQGIEHGVVNASGDLTAWGKRSDGNPWKIGIADPHDKNRIMLWIPIENAAVATSGDYEQYFEHDGKRYSHTLDPKTGEPISDVKSVTIVSPSAELSDALATAVFVMGPVVGIDFVEQLPNVHALMITASNKIVATSHMRFNHVT